MPTTVARLDGLKVDKTNIISTFKQVYKRNKDKEDKN